MDSKFVFTEYTDLLHLCCSLSNTYLIPWNVVFCVNSFQVGTFSEPDKSAITPFKFFHPECQSEFIKMAFLVENRQWQKWKLSSNCNFQLLACGQPSWKLAVTTDGGIHSISNPHEPENVKNWKWINLWSWDPHVLNGWNEPPSYVVFLCPLHVPLCQVAFWLVKSPKHS